MSGFVGPAGEVCAVIRIDGATDAVLTAYGCKRTVVTPTIAWDIEVSDQVGTAPTVETGYCYAQQFSAAGAGTSAAFTFSSPTPGSRIWRVTSVNMAAGTTQAAAGVVTIEIRRGVIPGAQ